MTLNGRHGSAFARAVTSSPEAKMEPPADSTRTRRSRAALVTEPREAMPRRLDEILRALPESELDALIGRLGIRIDPHKRIDVPSQAARALVGLPDVREPARLPAASRELLHRLAEAGGSLVVPVVPAGLEALLGRGVVYARKVGRSIELVLPAAFLVQLKTWESEDPRSLRALIAQAPFETVSAIASHHLGRSATPPIALSLEAAWEVLSDPARLAAEIEKLAPVERRLLESIEAVGGEVDTQELLDLEREPMRLRGAGGVTASRRGAGFALERRAFLVPIHPNRHVVPTEVAAIVGASRRAQRDQRRAEIRSFVLEEDHAPRRARFASDPASLALALAFAVREPGHDVRPGVGTPRSLVTRLAQRFGRDVDAVGMVVALSRATGLWDSSAVSPATPPGSLCLHEVGPLLFSAWRRGGAWDEARGDREVLRTAGDGRDASPIGALRGMVLEALTELGEGRWVPWRALEGYLAADERIPGIERLLRRWADRAAVEPPPVLEVARRMALESLPVLGILDLGGDPDDGVDGGGTTLRMTPRGRALLQNVAPAHDASPAKFIDTQVLRLAPSSRVAAVLALVHFAELGRVGSELDLVLTPQSIARALSAGLESDAVRGRIEAIAPLSEGLSKLLVQASVVMGRASFAAASGFLWIEDADIRELLRTRRPASELFVDPSPPAGLLVAADVDADKLVRRCRALGIEVEVEANGAMRARPANGASAASASHAASAGPDSSRAPGLHRQGRSKTPVTRPR
jgi:hypothetical protein